VTYFPAFSFLLASLVGTALIGLTVWFTVPKFESVPDGLGNQNSDHPGVIVTNRRTGDVDWCHHYIDNWVCEPVRFRPTRP